MLQYNYTTKGVTTISVALQPFTFNEKGMRQHFVTTIEHICAQEGITVDWLSDYWVGRLQKENQVLYIKAYYLPLNNAGASGIALDKVASYQVFAAAGLPMVPHFIVRFMQEYTPARITSEILKKMVLPVVIKPNDRGGGKDVYKAATPQELKALLIRMEKRYATIAISPFEEIIDEYRVIMLDHTPHIVYCKKQTDKNEWRHNLQFGSQPQAVTNPALKKELIAMADTAMGILGLRFAAVDIITTAKGMKVMEVNAGFSMGKLSKTAEFSKAIEDTYRAALRACFASA